MAIVLRTVLFMTMLIFLIHVSFGFKENEIFDFNSHLDIIRVTQYFVRYNIETKKMKGLFKIVNLVIIFQKCLYTFVVSANVSEI